MTQIHSIRPALTRFVCLLSTLLVLALGVPAVAQDVALTVLNSDSETPVQEYSLEDLDRLTQVTIVTSNEFVDAPTSFAGPLVRDVVSRSGGAATGTATLVAANDYEIMIDIAEFFEYDVVMATRADGNLLSRRTKGPIWIIYPMSDHPELQDASFNARLIWQLVRMELN